MSATPLTWIACLIVTVVVGLGTAYSQESRTEKKPLDLPSGGRGTDADEEDAPETIAFYGGEYEGDAFFWCLDRSCSMGWAGEIEVLKEETREAISSLSESADFSLVAFGSSTVVWSPIPRAASAGAKAGAQQWVQALVPTGATCLGPAAIEILSIAQMSDQEHRQLIVVSDGVPTCGSPASTLTAITGANWERIPINTIYIASDAEGAGFMQSLAAANGGTFRQEAP